MISNMGKSNQKKKTGAKTSASMMKETRSSSSQNTTTTLLPLPFPSHYKRPSNDFLRDEEPYKESFQSALATAYEGFVVDASIPNREEKMKKALQAMLDRSWFRADVTQPFGLGTKCAKTYVTRCLLGEPGTTYKYLGLRMFAHSWKDSEIQSLATILTQRTQHHLTELDKIRSLRGAQQTRGRPNFDICLINRMEARSDLKTEPSIGNAKTSVSWHADSSLEHYSTIAVYQTLDSPLKNEARKEKKGSDQGKWFVALRVAHNSEGPQSSRRGTDIESSIVKDTPPIAVSLPSGSTYFLLDDFNHHHQHTVITNGDSASAGTRFSCTYRLLRDSHNVDYVINRCRTTCSNFHKKGSKLWRSEQLLLTELESEWLRQFYIQGSQHHDILWSFWKDPIQHLLSYWSQLESRTKQVVDFLRAAAEGRCGLGGPGLDQASSKAGRKERERRKKALATLEDILDRCKSVDEKDALKSVYKPLAELLEQRAEMRGHWAKREKDHVFHEVEQECRPMLIPIHYERPANEKRSLECGSSPLPGSEVGLKKIAASLRALGKAYNSKNSRDLPASEFQGNAATQNVDIKHAKPFDWLGWAQHCFGLELQHPWAGAIVDGTKEIETRSYDLPSSLLGKRVIIIQSPDGTAGVSEMGNFIDFSESTARVIGWCIFISIKKYTTQETFEADEKAHLVSADSGYGWKKDKTKVVYGWIVGECGRFESEKESIEYKSAVRRMRSLFQLKQIQSETANGKLKQQQRHHASNYKGGKKRRRY